VQRRRFLELNRLRVCDARNEATWRVSSTMRSSILALMSGIAGEILAIVYWLVTPQILSARWEVESRLPSVWSASIACTCGVDGRSRWCGGSRPGRPVLEP